MENPVCRSSCTNNVSPHDEEKQQGEKSGFVAAVYSVHIM